MHKNIIELTLLLVIALLTMTSTVISNDSTFKQFDAINIFVDTSGSIINDEYVNALSTLATKIDTIVFVSNVTTVGILPFAGEIDAWKSPSEQVSLPRKRSVEKQEIQTTEGNIIFKHYKENQIQALERSHDKNQQETDSLYKQEVTNTLQPLMDYLKSIDQGKSDCTSLNDVIDRIILDGNRILNIIITDGLETCSKDLRRLNQDEDLSKISIVVFILPSIEKNDCDYPYASQLKDRTREWNNIFPSAIILPSYKISKIDEWLK